MPGVTYINVTRKEQICLPKNKYLGYCPNYLCAYAQFIDAHISKVWSFYHKYLTVIDIDMPKKR